MGYLSTLGYLTRVEVSIEEFVKISTERNFRFYILKWLNDEMMRKTAFLKSIMKTVHSLVIIRTNGK